MEDVNLRSARSILVNITCHAESMALSEVDEVQEVIAETVPDCAAQQFSGVVFDDDMGDELRVTIIITGITESDALGDISAEPSLETIRDTSPATALFPDATRKNARNTKQRERRITKSAGHYASSNVAEVL